MPELPGFFLFSLPGLALHSSTLTFFNISCPSNIQSHLWRKEQRGSHLPISAVVSLTSFLLGFAVMVNIPSPPLQFFNEIELKIFNFKVVIRNGLSHMKRQYFKMVLNSLEEKVCSLQPYRKKENKLTFKKKEKSYSTRPLFSYLYIIWQIQIKHGIFHKYFCIC